MNTIFDRLYHIWFPSRSNLPAKLTPPTFRWNLRVILMLAVTTLGGTIRVQAGLLEASLSRVAGSNCAAEKYLAQPGVLAMNWLADLGLDGTWKRPLAASTQQLQVAAVFRQMPLSFEANVGQSDRHVSFLARGPDYTLFLTASAEAVLASGKGPSQVARMGLAGAKSSSGRLRARGTGRQSYYFIGKRSGPVAQ